MKVLTEIGFESGYIGVATLENGVLLLVRSGGIAEGLDGKTYAHVGREVGSDLLDVGWTPDASAPVILV